MILPPYTGVYFIKPIHGPINMETENPTQRANGPIMAQ